MSAIPPHFMRKTVGKTIADYQLINANDRILVGVSGGKDSWSLLHILLYFQRVSPIRFHVMPVTIDPGFPEFDVEAIEHGYRSMSPIPDYHIIRTRITDTIQASNEKGKNPCAFCARLRRGAIYRVARQLHCNSIALGHHADDAIETLLLSGFFEGNLSAMPPKLSVSRNELTLIRPLIRIWEEDLIHYSGSLGVPIVSCSSHFETPETRRKIKQWLTDLEHHHPMAKRNLLAGLHHLNPSHFLDPKWL